MIQPLRSEPSVWSLCWVDLPGPMPVEDDYFLPVILLLVGPSFEPLVAPEIFTELDQVQAEEWVARHFDELGAPDQLLVWKAPEWVPEDWKYFARDWKTKVKLVNPPPHEAKLQSELAGLKGTERAPTVSKTAVAEGLLRNLSRLRSATKRRATLEKAVEIDPSCAAARVELAESEFHAGHYERSLQLARQVEETDGALLRRRGVQWWTDRSTRPLLRALFGIMLCHWHLGRAADAAETGNLLLETDPQDHMGARFYVPLFHLLAGEHEDASLFFRHYAAHYPGDMPNAWLSFGWALTLCLEGDDQGARQKYREGIMANIYMAPRLLGERPPPEDIYHPSERDEPYSAVEFAGSFGGLWDREAAAMRVLRETHDEMRPVLEELIARRRALSDLMDQRYDTEYRAKWTRMVEEEEAFVKKVLQ
ncbi:MAG: tetratricopeptide repeat protein [Chthoniobacterales bacterium]